MPLSCFSVSQEGRSNESGVHSYKVSETDAGFKWDALKQLTGDLKVVEKTATSDVEIRGGKKG